jgi:Domain of unknown function (DUF3471)
MAHGGGGAEPQREPVAEGGTSGFDPATYDREDFDDFVGRYALDLNPNFEMTFTREGDSLVAQATGQPRFPIVPTSDSTFKLLVVEASMTFHRNVDGEVDGLTLYQGGQEMHASRLEGETWKPTVAELEEFECRYFSEEIETFYDIALENDTLVVHHRRLDDAKLTAGKEDTFSGGPFTFSFERDNGQMIGFYLSFVRTRDVRFKRVR